MMMFLFFILNSALATPFDFTFDCKNLELGGDTRGRELMKLGVRNRNSIRFLIQNASERTTANLEALRDVTSSPKKHQEFYRFYHNEKKYLEIYPSIFVENTILKGKRGLVRLGIENEFMTYDCFSD